MTKSVAELLADLSRLDIRVWAEGARLRISAPKGALTSSLRDELAARKEEILKILESQPPAARDGASAPEGRRAPVSFAQLRLWFLDQLHPGTAEYNIAGALRLRGDLDVGALDWSLREIVRRHEAMRTIFAHADSEPVQVITDPPPGGLLVRDVGGDATGDVEALLRQLMLEEARRPFDLARGPLFRATLLKVHERDHVLILVVHHIVADGWSAGVFVRELSACYEAHVTGRPSPLPELPIQYGDFAQWQRQWLTGAVLEKELGYWTRRLEGHSGVLELPGDRPRPAVQTFRGALLKRQLPKALSEALAALSRHEGVTLFMTLLAGSRCCYTDTPD